MDENRELISVSDLAGHPMHLHWMSGDEMLGGHLGGLFEYRMELASPAAEIKPREVLGKKLPIKLALPEGRYRYFNGHVSLFSYYGVQNDLKSISHPALSRKGYGTGDRPQ